MFEHSGFDSSLMRGYLVRHYVSVAEWKDVLETHELADADADAVEEDKVSEVRENQGSWAGLWLPTSLTKEQMNRLLGVTSQPRLKLVRCRTPLRHWLLCSFCTCSTVITAVICEECHCDA